MMSESILSAYGLSGAMAQEAAAAGLPAGRVVSQARDLWRVVCEDGEGLCTLSGAFRRAAQTAAAFPAVGDFVLLDRCPDADNAARIQRVLPRRSAFLRKAAGTAGGEQVVAANIDTVLICMSMNHDFNLRRLERYLAAVWDSGARPVAVLTKADLCDDVPGLLLAAESVCAGAEVLAVTAMETDGYAAIRGYFGPGQTVALTGSSGVGKSTLINRLLGADRLATAGLRDDDRGRHTTTRRELLLLPEGGAVIDTPGMRELGMWDAAEGLDRAFAEVEALFSQCRFRNCTHTGEPGCAVRAALEDGTLAPERWRSYQKLAQEAAYAADQAGYLAKKTVWAKNVALVNRAKKK